MVSCGESFLLLQTGFAFSQIVSLGDKSPFAVKYAITVVSPCQRGEEKEMAEKVRRTHGLSCGRFWCIQDDVLLREGGASGRRLELMGLLAMQEYIPCTAPKPAVSPGLEDTLPRGSEARSAQIVCRDVQRDGEPCCGWRPAGRVRFGKRHCVCVEKDKGCGPAFARPQPFVLLLNLAQIN